MFDSFLQDLLELAKSCDFCSGCEDSLIRDRIIIGLKDADTIDKLLDEAGITYSYLYISEWFLKIITASMREFDFPKSILLLCELPKNEYAAKL